MSRKAFLSVLLIASIVFGGLPLASAPVSAPAIEWQREYEMVEGGVEAVNNLIQTSDGGYAFTSSAWSYQETFKPSTFYKADSSGSLQWNKTIPFFSADTVIQTNDEGYEIAGRWDTYGTSIYKKTPTLLKTDSQGNIQWNQNYSSVPDLGVNSTFIQTSDSGFAYLQFWTTISAYGDKGIPAGGIVKTDSNYNTQWVKNLTYVNPLSSYYSTFPLALSSLVETSDGALAVLAVGLEAQGFPRSGVIYLVKTEAFLPLPSQTPLPTPLPTPTPTPTLTVENAVIASLIIAGVVGAGLLVYFKKRKR